MSLFTVRFTTRKVVTRYNAKREVVSEEEMNLPVTITGLPHTTAMAYSGNDNFTIEREIADYRNEKVKSRPRARTYDSADLSSERTPRSRPAKTVTSVQDAARTGDMAAAINGAN